MNRRGLLRGTISVMALAAALKFDSVAPFEKPAAKVTINKLLKPQELCEAALEDMLIVMGESSTEFYLDGDSVFLKPMELSA